MRVANHFSSCDDCDTKLRLAEKAPIFLPSIHRFFPCRKSRSSSRLSTCHSYSRDASFSSRRFNAQNLRRLAFAICTHAFASAAASGTRRAAASKIAIPIPPFPRSDSRPRSRRECRCKRGACELAIVERRHQPPSTRLNVDVVVADG